MSRCLRLLRITAIALHLVLRVTAIALHLLVGGRGGAESRSAGPWSCITRGRCWVDTPFRWWGLDTPFGWWGLDTPFGWWVLGSHRGRLTFGLTGG